MKGQVLDILFLPAILFAIALIILLLATIVFQMYPPLLEKTNLTNTQIGKNLMETPNTLNYIVWGSIIALVISVIFSAYFIRTNPIFFGVSIFLLIFAVYFTMAYSNVFESIYNSNGLIANTIDQMSALSWLKDNFVYFIAGLGFIGITLTYIVWRTSNEGVGGV